MSYSLKCIKVYLRNGEKYEKPAKTFQLPAENAEDLKSQCMKILKRNIDIEDDEWFDEVFEDLVNDGEWNGYLDGKWSLMKNS